MGLLPVVVRAVQEQEGTIAAVRAQYAKANAENARLATRMAKLEQTLQQLLAKRSTRRSVR